MRLIFILLFISSCSGFVESTSRIYKEIVLVTPCFNQVVLDNNGELRLEGQNLSHYYNRMRIKFLIDVCSSNDEYLAFTLFGASVNFKNDTVWNLSNSSIDSIVVSRKFYYEFLGKNESDTLLPSQYLESVKIPQNLWPSVISILNDPNRYKPFFDIRLVNSGELLVDVETNKIVGTFSYCKIYKSEPEVSECSSFNGNKTLKWVYR